MAKVSVGDAWGQTLAFLAGERKLVVPVALAFSLAPTALLFLAAPQSGDVEAMMRDGIPPLASLLSYLAIILNFIGMATIILLAVGRREALGALIGQGARRTLTIFLALIILALMLMPLALAILIPFGGGFDPTAATPKLGGEVILLTLVVVLIFLRLFLMVPAIVNERVGAWAGLKRGWALGKGNGLKLIGTFGLLMMASAIATRAVHAVFGTVLAVTGSDDGLTVGTLFVGLVLGFVSALFQSIQAGMLAFLYRQASGADVAA